MSDVFAYFWWKEGGVCLILTEEQTGRNGRLDESRETFAQQGAGLTNSR